jgi:hypothetical protein
MSQIENIPELNTPSIDTNIPEVNIPEIEQGEAGKDVVVDPSLGESGSTECNVCEMLETISAPGLSNSNYGKDIEDVFSNIDKNFKVVANHDFIKGENGDTIEVEYVKLNDGVVGVQLYDALKSALFVETPKNVGLYNWDYDINNYVVPLVKIVNINKEEYIGSTNPLLFIDYRFSSNVLASVSQDSYIDVTNLSCIVNFKYSNNEWVCEIDKSFPRIQYNSDKKYFEWILNNKGTTICATGIKGDKGDKLIMHFKDVDVNELKDSVFEVKYNKEEIISEGDPVLLYLYDDNETNYKGYYIGYIKYVDKENTKFEVEYDENYVNKLDFAKNTYEFFKSLNINNSNNEPAQGIFLPFNNDETKAHVIYNNGSKLNIKAVNSYEDFNSTQLPSTINIDAKDSSINIGNDIKLKTNFGDFSINDDSTIQMSSKQIDIVASNNINIEISGNQPTNNVTIDSDVNITGSVSSSLGFYQTSDERLKEYKGDINVDLDKLLLLPKKYFTWKLDRNGKMEIGTSAQEVQKLYPELVTKDLEGKLVVAYDKLSIVALRAIDMLNSKNKELESRIERLEKLIK